MKSARPLYSLNKSLRRVQHWCYFFSDYNTQMMNMCAAKSAQFNHTTYLVYTSTSTVFKECECFLKNGYFTIALSDIRLQVANTAKCSLVTLHVNSVQLVCDDKEEDFGSVFLQESGAAISRAFVSLTKPSSTTGEPRMVWVKVQPKGKQENIDAKHQYAGKLICHALLSSL